MAKSHKRAMQAVISGGIDSRSTTLPVELQERIRLRAYELYEQRGRVDGFAEEDWAQAEREVLAHQGK
jgi:DUF2934 family protein